MSDGYLETLLSKFSRHQKSIQLLNFSGPVLEKYAMVNHCLMVQITTAVILHVICSNSSRSLSFG